MYLDEIAVELSKINHNWSAILLQKSLLMYQNQFLKFIELSLNEKFELDDFSMKKFFEKIANIITKLRKIINLLEVIK